MSAAPDICIRRHRGNPESIAANAVAQPHKANDRDRILSLIRARGPLTLAEACVALGRQKNEISGRFTEAAAMCLIERTGERRGGCAVWRLRMEPGSQGRLWG